MVRTYTTWYKCLFCTRVYPLAPQLIEHRKKFHLEQFREYRLAKKLKKSNIEALKQNDDHNHSNGTDIYLDSTDDNLSVTQLSTSSSLADISSISISNSDSATEIIELADNSQAKDKKKVKFDLSNIKKERGFTKTWNCDKCTKTFRNKWGLTMHKDVHMRNRYVVKRHVPIKRERVI